MKERWSRQAPGVEPWVLDSYQRQILHGAGCCSTFSGMEGAEEDGLDHLVAWNSIEAVTVPVMPLIIDE